MNKLMLLFLGTTILFYFTEAKAQFVAEGWRVAAVINANSDLVGTWDIIGGLDLDNDGNQEFIFSKDPVVAGLKGNAVDASASQSVFYYESAGDDLYEERWSFTATIVNRAENIYTSIAVGDVDKDGLTELYFGTPLDVSDSSPNPRGLYVFEFDGTNFPITPSETWNFDRPDNHTFKNSGIAIGDVDSDGDVEIVFQSRGDDAVAGEGGRTMMVVNSGDIDIGLGFGAFSIEFENSSNHEGGVVYDPRIVDFDDDGKMEIWVFTWDFWSLAIYEATGSNTYELQVELDKLYEGDEIDFGHRRGMQFYDVNGDGKLEFYHSGIVASGAEGSFVFYIGSTDDVSTLTTADVIELGGQDLPYAGSAVGDLDGDGLMDFLFSGRNLYDEGGKIHRMEYKGSGDLAQGASYEFSLLYEDSNRPTDLRNIAIGDFDSDNKMDVIITQPAVSSTEDAILIILESETPLSVEKTTEMPTEFSLSQNYPNPFNPTTTIEFDIKAEQHVSLIVYNILGEKVATLVDETRMTGAHKVNFAASTLNSGIYYYTLESGGLKSTKKMLVIK